MDSKMPIVSVSISYSAQHMEKIKSSTTQAKTNRFLKKSMLKAIITQMCSVVVQRNLIFLYSDFCRDED